MKIHPGMSGVGHYLRNPVVRIEPCALLEAMLNDGVYVELLASSKFVFEEFNNSFGM